MVYEQKIRGLRRLQVKGFERYLIFCLALADSIEAVRVALGARDLSQ